MQTTEEKRKKSGDTQIQVARINCLQVQEGHRRERERERAINEEVVKVGAN